jgi:hypothetical protein
VKAALNGAESSRGIGSMQVLKVRTMATETNHQKAYCDEAETITIQED